MSAVLKLVFTKATGLKMNPSDTEEDNSEDEASTTLPVQDSPSRPKAPSVLSQDTSAAGEEHLHFLLRPDKMENNLVGQVNHTGGSLDAQTTVIWFAMQMRLSRNHPVMVAYLFICKSSGQRSDLLSDSWVRELIMSDSGWILFTLTINSNFRCLSLVVILLVVIRCKATSGCGC